VVIKHRLKLIEGTLRLALLFVKLFLVIRVSLLVLDSFVNYTYINDI